MKRALVLACILVLGLGTWAFAAAPFSGSWETTIGLDVSATSFANFITTFDNTLTLDYTIGSWVFGSMSTFAVTGYSAQSFTAAGTLGAFTFDSTMTFAPNQVTVWTYPDVLTYWVPLALLVYFPTQTGTDALCASGLWKGTATTSEPAFLTWTATGSVSIAGVSLEGLFYLDHSNAAKVTNENYLFLTTGTSPNLTITGQTDSITCPSAYNGSGWRFKVAGEAGGMTITSLTYFNLDEYTNADLSTTGCPTIGMSGIYYIANAGCDVGFTREYITLEGFGFGCATVDFALDINCSGFSSLEAFVQNVAIGNLFNLDFSVTFATGSKTFNSCLSFTGLSNKCFTIEVGLPTGPAGTSTPSFSGLAIHGIGLTYTWNGITFKDLTELDAYSTLFSKSGYWTYVNSPATKGFLVPYTGAKTCAGTSATCPACPTPATYWNSTDNVYQLNCVPTDRFKLWEQFELKYAADSCCGGALSLTVDTYFGDYQTLDYFAYATVLSGSTVYGTPVYLLNTTGASFSDLTTAATHEITSTRYGYKAGTLTTLFGWAKSAVTLSFGVGSNFTLSVGGTIDAFGVNTLDLGFKTTF